jgi:peptidoglycan-associated lipoprotein
MRASHLPIVLAVAAMAAACGGKPAPEQPQPQPEPAVTQPTVNQDSIDAANRAAEEARKRADAERMAREAAERARALLAEVAQPIHFDYDKADIRPSDQALLDRKAAIMAANPTLRVRIAGNADERGSDEYNLALGNRRAAAAKRYLAGKGIDESRIEVISYGEERPVMQGSTEEAYAANRRDDFEITAGGDNLQAPR